MAQKGRMEGKITDSKTGSPLAGISVIIKETNNGVATLDSNGKVPSTQLPSFVDDVLEYATLGNFPATGASGIIYIAITLVLFFFFFK